jgi:hypothetical protein
MTVTYAVWICYLQALTRVFTPIQQWLYFDAVECLPSAPLAPEDRLPCGSRYDHQIALFGREFQDKLGSLQVPKYINHFANVDARKSTHAWFTGKFVF